MCKRPLKGWPVGKWPDSGKDKYLITSYDVDFVVYNHNLGKYLPKYGTPYEGAVTDFKEIPCGQCMECRLNYAREWADRLMLENTYHDESWFITLTYDDDHLPLRPEIVDRETGEILLSPFNTLIKSEPSSFMKRLRKNTGQELRVYYCGEYGTETYRPHYHLIVFGLHLNDLQIYKKNFNGDILYNSPTIDKAWQFRGYAVLGQVTWNSCCYVARYVTKKLKGVASSYYNDFGLEPPFVGMSRRPGIARHYFDDNFDRIYKYDRIFLTTPSGGKNFKPPKYFDKLYDIEYPLDLERIKQQRAAVAEKAKKYKLNKTDVDYLDLLRIEEDALINRLGKIKERSNFI